MGLQVTVDFNTENPGSCTVHSLKPGSDGFHFETLESENNQIWDMESTNLLQKRTSAVHIIILQEYALSLQLMQP